MKKNQRKSRRKLTGTRQDKDKTRFQLNMEHTQMINALLLAWRVKV
jgi:hypothetical protein